MMNEEKAKEFELKAREVVKRCNYDELEIFLKETHNELINRMNKGQIEHIYKIERVL